MKSLKLRPELIIVTDDKKGKRLSWEASLSYNGEGGDLYLFAFGDCEGEARARLDEKLRELIEGVAQESPVELDDPTDDCDFLSENASFTTSKTNPEVESTQDAPEAEELESYRQTWEHIDTVMRLLLSAQIEFSRRAITHDRTKLVTPERQMFARMTSKLRDLTYGSPEYKECLQEMRGQALGHHYAHNRHHPEFFEPQPESDEIYNYKLVVGWAVKQRVLAADYNYERLMDYLCRKQAEHISSVNNMNLFDIFEMFLDWIAASQRHANGNIVESIQINTERFALSPQLVRIFENTVPWVHDAFKELKTQNDLCPPKK